MESTDLDRTASEIQSSVDDLKTEVIYFKEALQKLLEAAQDGIDDTLRDFKASKTPPRAKSRNLPILGIFFK